MKTSGTILLIEEDQELRKVLRELLEHMGYWVVAAPGAERLPRIFEIAATADLLVADVTVPGSDSVALTEDLLDRRRDLGALLISTDDTALEVRRRFKDGRTRFLHKPFAIAELRETVAAVPLAAPAAAGPSPGRRFAAWGLAAAAVLAVVAGALLSGTGPAPPLPEAPESTVARGAPRVKLLEPTGDRPEMPARLAWEEVADASRYRVRILAVDDTVLWQGESSTGALTLPPQALAALHPGVVYYWTVDALDTHGEVKVVSEAARFQVVPPREPRKGE